MKTIFITAFTGLIARNILATDAFDILRQQPGLRLVIITPQRRAEVLGEEYGGSNVIIAGVEVPPLKGVDHALWVLATNLLPSRTRKVQRIAKLERDEKYLNYFFSGAAGFLGRFKLARRIFRILSVALADTSAFEYLFRKYRPDLLFATDVFTPLDVKLMRLAKRRKVKTVGMVRSWDNVTSKTLLSFIPERMVVNTARIRKELHLYGDVPEESVFCCGIPHYDRYNSSGRAPRDEFFKKLGLDPQKKLILFTPPSDSHLKHDAVAPIVLKSLEKVGAQVVVRLPLVGKADLGDYRPPAGVVFDEPGSSPDFTEAHLSRAADRHLADSIFHSDLVVTWASTMIIDAIVFDKPVVLVGFDVAPRSYGRSIQQYYDYDHQRDIIGRGGVRFAASPAELKHCVGQYLANPSLDFAGRKKIRDEFCGPLDGKSGERLAKIILSPWK